MVFIEIILSFFFVKYFYLDIDGDGSITPLDFEILADKLSALIGQDDIKRREDYANARKTLCKEIMRADANQDGKVTLGKHPNYYFFLKKKFFLFRRMARFSSTSCKRIT
jgi:hypothetical protein